MTTPRPGPVTAAERIPSLDVLRGVAVLGILLMNIQSFAMVMAAYDNPAAWGDLSGVHGWTWLGSHLLADQKFMTIFSMLFGAGVALMTRRAQRGGGHPAGMHYRRMGWLLVIGLLHAYCLWFGDILVGYALTGMLVYLVRRWPSRVLLVVAVAMLAVPSAIFATAQWSLPYWPDESLAELATSYAPNANWIAIETGALRGSWLEQMPMRAQLAISMQVFVYPIWIFWRVGGLMLLGMVAYRTGVFSAARSGRFYGTMIALGLGLGVPLILLGVHRNVAADWDPTVSMFGGRQWNYWGSLGVAAAWIGLVMLWCRAGVMPRMLGVLAATGRMALTNYLMQTILCTSLFYGHGLGLFGRLERLEQLAVVVGVWILQLAWSPWWLRRFRFGPLEWAWRSLTYGRRQPMRR